jgi:hypothetical protein
MKFSIKFFFLFIILIVTCKVNAQDRDYSLGANLLNTRFNQQGGFFDYSDPEAINIKIAVWGWVKYPGRYTVPNYTTLSDFLSLAGGPVDGAELDNIRIYRTLYDSTQLTLKYNYDDFYRNDESYNKPRNNPRMEAGDIVAITGRPRLFFRDNFSMWLSVFSALISLSILVLNIVRN